MPISFVWLYMFKCNLCMLNCFMIKPKNIFEYFICFLKCFTLSFVIWKFFQKAKCVLLKNFFVNIFASASQVRFPILKSRICGSEFPILSQFCTESLMTPSRVIHEICLPTNLALCQWGFSQVTRKSLASHYLAKWVDFQFLKRLTVTAFQIFCFASLVSLSTQNIFFS